MSEKYKIKSIENYLITWKNISRSQYPMEGVVGKSPMLESEIWLIHLQAAFLILFCSTLVFLYFSLLSAELVMGPLRTGARLSK